MILRQYSDTGRGCFALAYIFICLGEILHDRGMSHLIVGKIYVHVVQSKRTFCDHP